MLSTVFFFDGGKVNFRLQGLYVARGCVVGNNKIRVLVSEDTNIPVFYLYLIRATKYTVRR